MLGFWCLILTLLGLPWILGYLIIDTNTQSLLFAYMFTIVNSSQGTLVFVFHCLVAKNVRDDLLKCLRRQKTRLLTSISNSSFLFQASQSSSQSNKKLSINNNNNNNSNNPYTNRRSKHVQKDSATLKRGSSNASSSLMILTNNNKSTLTTNKKKKFSLSSSTNSYDTASSLSPPLLSASSSSSSNSATDTQRSPKALLNFMGKMFHCVVDNSGSSNINNKAQLASTVSSSLSCSNSFDIKNNNRQNIPQQEQEQPPLLTHFQHVWVKNNI